MCDQVIIEGGKIFGCRGDRLIPSLFGERIDEQEGRGGRQFPSYPFRGGGSRLPGGVGLGVGFFAMGDGMGSLFSSCRNIVVLAFLSRGRESQGLGFGGAVWIVYIFIAALVICI